MFRRNRLPSSRLPWLGLVCGGLMCGAVACQNRPAALGSLPRRARQALPASAVREGRPLTEEEQQRIYRLLYPHFGEVRQQPMPFRNDCPEYVVREVTIERLRTTCDVEASVWLTPADSLTAEGSVRLYALSIDRDGRVFDRSLALATPRGEEEAWCGKLTLHLLSEPEGYETFGYLRFVSDEAFHAAADAIRHYPAATPEAE